MQRTKVYIIPVSRVAEKQLIQLPLPENAMVINGVNVSADIYADVENKNSINLCAGSISLTIPETGDVFFQELVKSNHINDYWEYRLAPNFSKQFYTTWNDSIGYPPLRIHLVDTTFITAYYEDFINKLGQELQKYNVRVYLHYCT